MLASVPSPSGAEPDWRIQGNVSVHTYQWFYLKGEEAGNLELLYKAQPSLDVAWRMWCAFPLPSGLSCRCGQSGLLGPEEARQRCWWLEVSPGKPDGKGRKDRGMSLIGKEQVPS